MGHAAAQNIETLLNAERTAVGDVQNAREARVNKMKAAKQEATKDLQGKIICLCCPDDALNLPPQLSVTNRSQSSGIRLLWRIHPKNPKNLMQRHKRIQHAGSVRRKQRQGAEDDGRGCRNC